MLWWDSWRRLFGGLGGETNLWFVAQRFEVQCVLCFMFFGDCSFVTGRRVINTVRRDGSAQRRVRSVQSSSVPVSTAESLHVLAYVRAAGADCSTALVWSVPPRCSGYSLESRALTQCCAWRPLLRSQQELFTSTASWSGVLPSPTVVLASAGIQVVSEPGRPGHGRCSIPRAHAVRFASVAKKIFAGRSVSCCSSRRTQFLEFRDRGLGNQVFLQDLFLGREQSSLLSVLSRRHLGHAPN
ncbi:hypothetical protein NDU88_005746 [Pleurodeles waltl]|uniref:Uncharacterized protein n=1 Tax=Pleurodeles waltl TaxID=8319 RepID=A0AAV7UMM6_PLEWA|nr:hypothetical protein NDU88_005746 [Pleurodeles waltl]